MSFGSHEVLNNRSLVVAVGVGEDTTHALVGAFCEGVGDKTIAGLEANLGLEAVLANGTNHLQRNICLLYTSPSPRDKRQSRMPSSA